MMSEETPNRKEPANPEPEIQKDSNSRQLYAKAMNKQGRRYKREGREKVQWKIHAFYVRPFVRQIGTRGGKKGGANHREQLISNRVERIEKRCVLRKATDGDGGCIIT
jgi:hypothetical protein